MQLRHLATPAVAVRDTQASGPTVVLVHGNSFSGRSFLHQLEGPLGRTFRLIALDLPGHGESAWAVDPEKDYLLSGFASVLVEVAKQLDATRAVFVGWSLGGHIVLEAAAQLPAARGFCIFGAPPIASAADFPRAFAPDPSVAVAFRSDSTDAEVAAYLQKTLKPGTAVPPSFREDFERADPRSRAVLGASVPRGDFTDETKIVATLTRPLAVLHGRHDALIQRAYFDHVAMPTLWRGAVQEFADAGHTPQCEAPEDFDRLLSDFVTEANAA